MSLKRPIDLLLELIDAKCPKIELTEFLKYTELAPELRLHIVSYLQEPTLKNYRECSKYCNAEVKKCTLAPYEVAIENGRDYVHVTIAFPAIKHHDGTELMQFHILRKEFEKSENVMKDVHEHILKHYKYVKNGRTERLHITLKEWPKKVMSIKKLAQSKEWIVDLYPETYADFMKCVKENQHQLDYLRITGYREARITRKFFKTDFFKRITRFHFNVQCQIDDDDFINLESESVYLVALVSYAAIRQKVEKMNEAGKKQCIYIIAPEGSPVVFDVNDIFQPEFYPTQEDGIHRDFRQIGEVRVMVRTDGTYSQLKLSVKCGLYD